MHQTKKKKIRLLNQLGRNFAERVNEETSELESELIKGLPGYWVIRT